MPASDESSDSVPRGAAQFTTTRWSMVLLAAENDTTRANAALAQLCRAYWLPIYAFIRRRGHNVEEAKDLTQGFFAELLAKSSLAAAQQEKGRFRSFLLTALKFFLANQWDRAQALKRGGAQTFIELDAATAEERYRIEPAESFPDDTLFDRRWALAVLEQVMAALREDYRSAGKEAVFEALKPLLTQAESALPYAGIGARLGMTEAAIKVAVHRLRQRYRELLRKEIAETVSNPDEVEDELRYLFAALARQG